MKNLKIIFIVLLSGIIFYSCKNSQFSQQKYAHIEKIPVNEKVVMPERKIKDDLNITKNIQKSEDVNIAVTDNTGKSIGEHGINSKDLLLADNNANNKKNIIDISSKRKMAQAKSLLNKANSNKKMPSKLSLKGKIQQFKQLQQLKKALKSNAGLSTTDILLIVLLGLIGLILLLIFGDLIILLLLLVLLLLLILLLMKVV